MFEPLIEFLTSESFPPFILQLLASLFGAVFGFAGAMIINSRGNKKAGNVRKKNTIAAIHEELKSVEIGIKELDTPHIKWNQDKLEFEGNWLSISTPAFDSSINSGDFSLLDTPLQTDIGFVYLSIEELQVYIQQRLQFPFTMVTHGSESKKEGDRLVHYTNKVMDKLIELLPPLQAKLKNKKRKKFLYIFPRASLST